MGAGWVVGGLIVGRRGGEGRVFGVKYGGMVDFNGARYMGNWNVWSGLVL